MKIVFIILAILAFLALLVGGSCFYAVYRIKEKAKEYKAEMGNVPKYTGGTIAMKLAHGALKSVAGGMDTFTEVPGLGDEAYIMPEGSGLMMRKGDVLVNVDMRAGGLNADAAKAMARKIAGRL